MLVVASFLLQATVTPAPPAGGIQPCPDGYLGVHQVPGTTERYFIDGPYVCGPPAPLVVTFHGTGGDHTEIIGKDFHLAAVSDHFVMMCDGGLDPLGGNKTQGSEDFHAKTQAAIADALAKFPIDRDRVYAYGFSMGGGNALNYAARHQDPTREDDVVFAAVVNHTGAVSFTYTYFFTTGFTGCASNDCSVTYHPQCFWNWMYGVTSLCTLPDGPFAFWRATNLAVFNPALGQGYFPTFSAGHNLRALPVETWWDTQNAGLVEQNALFNAFMSSDVNKYVDNGSIGGGHGWNTLDPTLPLAVFAANDLPTTLATATDGVTYVVEDGARYLFFRGVREDVHDFGRLAWKLDASANRVDLQITPGSTNLQSATVEIDDFTPALDAEACLDLQNDIQTVVTLTGYDRRPTAVLKDGVSQVEGPTTWEWDDAADAVHVWDTAVALWTVVPNGVASCP